MTSKNQNQADSILQAYLAEYQSICQEILSRIDAQKQILNLQVAVIAASVSAVTFIKTVPILYLFGALLLNLLSWVMMEQTVRMHAMGLYIRTVLTRKVDAIFPESVFPTLEWTNWVFSFNPNNIASAMLSSLKFFIGPFLAMLFCVFFTITKDVSGSPWTETETILLISNIVVFAIPVLLGIISFREMLNKPKAKKTE
jgi:hypothetical protein